MQFLANIDLTKNQLQNVVAHFLATAPAAPSEGQVYYNSTSKFLGFYNGTAWIILGRLDQMAVGASLSMANFKLINLGAPTLGTDAATKAYVDALVQGMAWKDEVRVATAAAGTLASSFANGQVVDGVTLVTGDRILIKNQATAAENGLYTVNVSGAPTRALDADSDGDLRQATVAVQAGTVGADTAWTLTNDGVITPGTTALVFVKVWGGASGGTIAKFSQDVGDGVATSIAVAHNLGTVDVIVRISQKTTPFPEVFPDVNYTDANTVNLVFASPPATAAYRCTVVG